MVDHFFIFLMDNQDQVNEVQSLMMKLMNIRINNLNLIQKLIMLKGLKSDLAIDYMIREKKITELQAMVADLTTNVVNLEEQIEHDQFNNYYEPIRRIQEILDDLKSKYNRHKHRREKQYYSSCSSDYICVYRPFIPN